MFIWNHSCSSANCLKRWCPALNEFLEIRASRALRSCEQHLLNFPHTRLKTKEDRVLELWMGTVDSVTAFEGQFRTYLFKSVFMGLCTVYFNLILCCESLCDLYLERCCIRKVLLTHLVTSCIKKMVQTPARELMHSWDLSSKGMEMNTDNSFTKPNFINALHYAENSANIV